MRELKQVTLLVATLSMFVTRAPAQVISNSPNYPPAGGVYVSAVPLWLYSNGTTIGGFELFNFSASFLPPQNVGDIATDPFNATSTGTLSTGGPATPFSASATAFVRLEKVAGPNGSSLGTFNTETLQLDLSGGTLPAGTMIRESPTLASTGQTVITPSGGDFRIDSFFDVFTELSLDGGQTWAPQVNGPSHIVLVADVPEPSSLVLGSLTILGLGVFHLRRRWRSR